MQTVVTAVPWPGVHTTIRQLETSVFARPPCRLRAAGATHARRQHPDEVSVAVLSSVGEVEASYHQLDIGQALARITSVVAVRCVTVTDHTMVSLTPVSQLLRKGLDLRTAMGKLSNDLVILYWHPAKNTSAIAFITTTRTEILSQKDARGIDMFIRSKLLDEDEKMKKSRLWWSLTVPPDFDSRIRGRLP